jgi:hypothetical protein
LRSGQSPIAQWVNSRDPGKTDHRIARPQYLPPSAADVAENMLMVGQNSQNIPRLRPSVVYGATSGSNRYRANGGETNKLRNQLNPGEASASPQSSRARELFTDN